MWKRTTPHSLFDSWCNTVQCGIECVCLVFLSLQLFHTHTTVAGEAHGSQPVQPMCIPRAVRDENFVVSFFHIFPPVRDYRRSRSIGWQRRQIVLRFISNIQYTLALTLAVIYYLLWRWWWCVWCFWHTYIGGAAHRARAINSFKKLFLISCLFIYSSFTLCSFRLSSRAQKHFVFLLSFSHFHMSNNEFDVVYDRF